MDTRKRKLLKSPGTEGFGERLAPTGRAGTFPGRPTGHCSHHTVEPHVGNALLLWSRRLWMNCTSGMHKTE